MQLVLNTNETKEYMLYLAKRDSKPKKVIQPKNEFTEYPYQKKKLYGLTKEDKKIIQHAVVMKYSFKHLRKKLSNSITKKQLKDYLITTGVVVDSQNLLLKVIEDVSSNS